MFSDIYRLALLGMYIFVEALQNLNSAHATSILKLVPGPCYKQHKLNTFLFSEIQPFGTF